MDDERLELIVDNEDIYQESDNVFYTHPSRLGMVRCLKDNQFSSCTIRHSSIDCLSSLNFSYIARKLTVGSVCEVIIYQPITVMQEFDAKQVEAHAKLAGFVNFDTREEELVDNKTNKKFKTLIVSFEKPLKNPNEVEIEVTVIKKSDQPAKVTATINKQQTLNKQPEQKTPVKNEKVVEKPAEKHTTSTTIKKK